MIEIKENIATITKDPLTFDIKDMIDNVRSYISDYMVEEYGEEEITNIDYGDYTALVNYVLEKAKYTKIKG